MAVMIDLAVGGYHRSLRHINFLAISPGCENLKISSERISRALAVENSRGGRGLLRPARAPRCRSADGEFEEIQCDNEINTSCWCVDAAGFEVRTSHRKL